MRRKWLWALLAGLPLAVGGWVYANSEKAGADEGYICPVTGEELPCPNCCPLNR